MPIFDLSYRHWHGTPTPRSRRFVPIAAAGIGPLLRRRAFIFWLVICWVPALVCGVMIYLIVSLAQSQPNLGSSGLFDATEDRFFQFFVWMFFLYLLTSVFAGAGLIANDRRTNALQIYLSKPLRPWDYLLGKACAVGATLGFVTIAPPLALFLLRVGLDHGTSYVRAHLLLPLSIIAGGALITITLTILSLTVSSLTKSSRTAGVALVMFYVFASALHGMLGILFGGSLPSVLSPLANLQQGLCVLFGREPMYDVSPAVSLLALFLMLAICVRVLWKRVRPVEVVL
jgi:ABC-2 type transport system permease protein